MKCDELKLERLGDANETYPASTLVIRKQYVDAAIAELKAKLYEAEEARIEAGADAADYYQENRKLKRALWLARAERAEARKNYWYVRSIHEGDKDLWSINGSAVKYIGCIKRTNYDWLLTWSEVESKCRAKAEEFK